MFYIDKSIEIIVKYLLYDIFINSYVNLIKLDLFYKILRNTFDYRQTCSFEFMSMSQNCGEKIRFCIIIYVFSN